MVQSILPHDVLETVLLHAAGHRDYRHLRHPQYWRHHYPNMADNAAERYATVQARRRELAALCSVTAGLYRVHLRAAKKMPWFDMNVAASISHVPALQMRALAAREWGNKLSLNLFSWLAVASAAARGHLEVLQWMHDNKLRFRTRRRPENVVEGRRYDPETDGDSSSSNDEEERDPDHHMSDSDDDENGNRWHSTDDRDWNNDTDVAYDADHGDLTTAAIGHGGQASWPVDLASATGQVQVLRWWADARGLGDLTTFCSWRAILGACANGHVDVLNFFRFEVGWLTRRRLLDVCDSIRAARDDGDLTADAVPLALPMDAAAAGGHINILQWFADRQQEDPNWPLIYTAAALDEASARGRVEVLTWFKNSKLPLLYTKASLNNASLNGEIGVLDWWARESGLPLRFSQAAVDLGSSGGHLPILRWWWDAYATGAIDRFLFSRSAMMRASANSHLTTLDWWKMIASTHATTDRPVVLIYDSALVLRTAVARNKRDVFEWWVASGLLVMERVESGDDDDWVRSTCVPYEHSKDIEWLRAWKTLRDARLGGVATTVPLPAADDDDDLIDRVPVPGPVPVTHERIDSGTEDEDSAKLLLDVVSHHQDDHVPAESGIAPAHVSVADLAPAAAGPADVTDVDVEVIGAVDPATIPLPTDDTGLDDGLADWPANHEADAEAGQEAVDADENASVAGSEDLNTSHDSDEEEETESEVDPMEKLPRIWRYDNNLIDDASREGALDVLDFMLANHKSDPVNWPFLLSDDALDYCCRDGMIDTSIKWFYDAYARGDLSREKLDAATSGWGLHFATRENHIHVLDFFAAHGMKLETKAHTLDTSSCSLETLSWWRDHKHLHCPGYSETAVDNASSSEDLERLAWWRDSGMEFKYSEEAIDEASREGRVSVLSWWLNESGIPHDQLKYSDKSVDDALKNDHWEILLWWRASGLPIKYTEEALYHVSDEGNVRALQWLLCCSLETGLLLKFERERVLQSFANDAVGQFWSALLLG